MSSATSTERPRQAAPFFFLAVSLLLATSTVVLLRGHEAVAVTLAALTILASGYAGLMLYRTLHPLLSPEPRETSIVIGGRTRAALERDKFLTLRSLKELEFDRAMGKVSESDFTEMRDRLRARALRLIKQLEGAEAYREVIERDLEARLAAAPAADAPASRCRSCDTVNDADAKFCKMCGRPLA